MKYIPLTQGKFATVNDEDYDLLALYRWNANKNGQTFYAVRSKPRDGGTRKKFHMHRVILGLDSGDGNIVDHINGNGLDNRKENLRVVSALENAQNKARNRAGLLSGVKKHKSGKFEARTMIGGSYKYIGVFTTEIEAHEAYKRYLCN